MGKFSTYRYLEVCKKILNTNFVDKFYYVAKSGIPMQDTILASRRYTFFNTVGVRTVGR